ncbi:hypothetical protein [Cryptosporangium aurantiacum]|uniref:Guanylate cyclase n=1 Tax=Cryptosporangium aurantiacum TaxID=134849 RepID=A0A1M7JF34_9ACTN|nr:hypothetical protein [Cryptosporangium aurantiacum]SHM51710.1 hypothetical protein SAMN05443668_101779 [Cryptosporangium aurantiacum]
MPGNRMTLTEAVEQTRTGDLWLFRGRTVADRAIQTLTNSPVNHVGMAVTIDDMPPLMWHAELGRSLPDVWAGTHLRGVQLHLLADAVQVWGNRYGQRAWLRQLEAPVNREMEDAVLRTIARLDGTPFPSTAGLAGRWARGRSRQRVRSLREAARTAFGASRDTGDAALRLDNALESAYCAEVVALTYQAMGLLPANRPSDSYDPGSFWSGDKLDLQLGARLGDEIEVVLPDQ